MPRAREREKIVQVWMDLGGGPVSILMNVNDKTGDIVVAAEWFRPTQFAQC
ncbi:MAG TPA: hypothetical protein VMW52_04260 [Phycisphaerae bacterium]|nr:hypothetical protein [Phycisphaerae bacterium]